MKLTINDTSQYSNRQLVMGTSEAYPGKVLISIEEREQIMQGYSSGAQITVGISELKNWLQALYRMIESEEQGG